MADEKRIDPRYDPAFQRGFDGPVASGLRRHPVAPPSSAIVTPAPYRASAEPGERGPDDDASRDMGPQADGAAPEPGRVGGVSSGDAEAVSPTRRLRRNPFLIALVVLGLALTVGGLIWANQARLLVSGRGAAATDLDYWFLQATVTGAPLTIVAGVSILAGVLFVAATAWNRGR